jgi:hypothetical protein
VRPSLSIASRYRFSADSPPLSSARERASIPSAQSPPLAPVICDSRRRAPAGGQRRVERVAVGLAGQPGVERFEAAGGLQQPGRRVTAAARARCYLEKCSSARSSAGAGQSAHQLGGCRFPN